MSVNVGGRDTSRTDLYSAIHKSLRHAVFELTFLAGRLDLGDADEAAGFHESLARLVARLRAHSEHEDRFIHPLLARRAPDVEGRLRREHAEHEADLAGILALWDECRAEATTVAALAFYRELSRFAARFLVHLDDEEKAMEVLWERASEQELARVLGDFRKSRSPAEMLADLELTLPALSHEERVATLRAIASSTPDSFTRARETAARVLDPRDRQRLFSELDS